MYRVLISDKMSSVAESVLRKRGIDVDVRIGMTSEELKACISEYDGLAIRSSTHVTRSILDMCGGRLKVIGRAGIGVDNVDIESASAYGIVVMNTPFGNTITTAEHTVAMLMSLARSIPQANLSMHEGRWEKSSFTGVELVRKTLGLIGCGNIGSIVSDRALGLKMKVICYDPFLSEERAADLGVEKVSFDVLLEHSDFISLHAPKTKDTEKMINATAFEKMKPGVFIVNCARGELIVEKDLKEAIKKGHVAGAALDVFEVEPVHESIFWGMKEIIATPHLGASTIEAQEKVAEQIAEQIANFLLAGSVENALNVPSVSAEEAARLYPYMTLSEILGSFLGQLSKDNIEHVTVEYEGKVSLLNTKPLTAILLKGLLSPVLSDVNMVNAPILAKKRNIALSEVFHERRSHYHTLIRLKVRTVTDVWSISGTLMAGKFGETEPRIVDVQGITLEACPGPYMLYVTNDDKPGFIGEFGRILGEANVNIATFHLGRTEAAGKAIVLVEVDEKIPENVLQNIKEISFVHEAKLLHFPCCEAAG